MSPVDGFRLVGEEGLEPSYPCGHWLLKPARLPIPPFALEGVYEVFSV